ncbi:MAG: hypothetical protein ACRC1H_17785, partial [Caldilineaceae bacterium]
TLATTRPSLVILTAQQLHTAASLLEMGEVLLQQRVPLAFGGLVFNRVPELHKAIPGHFLGGRLDAITGVVEQLMSNLRLQMAQRSANLEYREALGHFRSLQAGIEAGVWRRLEETSMPPRMLAAGNFHFSSNVAAALALGNLDYMSADLEWVDGLLTYHAGMPASQVDLYLQAYLDSARELLDARGRPLIFWLARLAGDQSVFDEARQHDRTAHRTRRTRA